LLRIPDRAQKTIAVLGCGTGTQLPFVADHFGRVIAVDPVRARLDRARRHAEGLGIEFCRHDLTCLRPLYGELDLVLALETPGETAKPDVDVALREIFRCLVEGGLMLATFPAVPRRSRPYHLPLGPVSLRSRRRRIHEVELQYRVRRQGFQGLRIRRVRRAEGAGEALLCMAVRRANN
jgi:SAM-dependent methyltransferase